MTIMSGQAVQPSAPITSGTARLTVNLRRLPDGTLRVSTCEFSSPRFRTRTTFGTANGIHAVFAPELAQALEREFSRFDDTPAVASLPDFALELPEVSLARAHVICAEPDEEGQPLMIRFLFVAGNLSQVFNDDVGIATAPAQANDRLLTELLLEVSLPLLNVLHDPGGLAATRPDRLNRLVQRLSDKARELEFQIELLKRLSESAAPDHIGPQAIPAPRAIAV